MSNFVTVTALIQQGNNITRHTIAGEPLAPGLAITPAIRGDGEFTGGWTITHTASGWSIIRANCCLPCLRRAATWLIEAGVDWTRDRETVIADLNAKKAANDFGAFAEDCSGPSCGADLDVLDTVA